MQGGASISFYGEMRCHLKILRLVTLSLALAIGFPAALFANQTQRAATKTPPPQASMPPAPVSEEKLGRNILAAAREQANAASPAVKGQVLLEIARQLSDDRKINEERALLREAYLATIESQSPRPQYNTINWIQADILRTMLKELGPEPLEELMPQYDPVSRGMAYDMLASHYLQVEDWDAEIRTMRQAPRDLWFPFSPAIQVMSKLPATRAKDRLEIWTLIYSICEGKGWLAEPVEKFWKELPRDQVLTAIPSLLEGAMYGDTHWQLRPVNAYARLKPRLMPIWKELNPAAAENWERNEKQHWDEAAKAGWNQPNCPDSQAGSAPASAVFKSPVASEASAPAPPKSVPLASRKPRPVIGCMEDEPWCQQNRVEHLLERLRDHLLKDEDELAKANVRRGFGYALAQWKLDTDPADPNQIVKTHWPSTVNWEAFAVMASRISPDYALRQVKAIPDPEIQLLVKVTLARTWLDHRPVFSCPQLQGKYHNGGACVPYYMYMPHKLFDWAN